MTECRHGHVDQWVTEPSGRRLCRACQRDQRARSAARLRERIGLPTVQQLVRAVDAMCRSCSEDVCRMPDCPLRAVSPLPLAARRTA